MAYGINNFNNNMMTNNSYGQQQGMSPFGMGMMGQQQQNPMQMMMMMMQMMMQMLQMMMGGNSMPGMGGGMPGMEGMPGMNSMPGMDGMSNGGFSPMMGNSLGNFLGNPGGGGNEGISGGGNNGGISPSNSVPQTTAANGSGGAAVNTARQFLGKNAIDIKGEMPHFTAAGGQTNNCADFVSSALESQGLIKGHHINVKEMEQSLLKQGYKRVPASQAKAGDVWMNSSRGHVELVQGVENGKLKLIGSNNDRPGHQKISENTTSLNDGVVYSKQ